jgi:hypothetical protein
MTLLSFQSYDNIPRAERIARIAMHIKKMARRDDSIQSETVPSIGRPHGPSLTPIDLTVDEVEKRIVGHLLLHGAVPPMVLVRELKISRVTLARKLARLRNGGLLLVSGKTRNAIYRLRTDFDSN